MQKDREKWREGGPRPWRLALSAFASLAALEVSGAAAAAGLHATSQSPLWQVGDPEPDLSMACRHNRFNQISDHRRYIAYMGETGSGVSGIARKGWNLRDPDGRAEPEATYHFADDGLSTCRVYVAREKKQTR